MLLKLEYQQIVLLHEILTFEINACIDSARSARLRAINHNDYRESDIALRWENRAESLMAVLDSLELLKRR